MSLDAVLSMVSELGLSVAVDESGTPHLRGPSEEAVPEVLAALKAYREEIVQRLKPAPLPPTRRVVLLDESGGVECVLWEGQAGKEQQAARDEAANLPGRTVAAEWLGKVGWKRYLTVKR